MSTLRKIAKSALSRMRRARIDALSWPRRSAWVRRRLWLPPHEIFDPLAPDAGHRARVIPLDAGGRFVRPLPRVAGGDSAAEKFFADRAVEQTAPAYVVAFEDGIAWGHPTGGVFTADSRFVPALTHDPSGASFHAAWLRLRFPKPRRLPGRTLYLVTPEAADNYHHWLIDLLPRIGLVERAGYALRDFDHIIVNHAARRYQLATLAHLGLRPGQLVAADPSLLVRADILVVPSLKPVNQTLPAADLAFLRRAFPAPAPQPARARRIFITRRDAAFRRLRNEDALLPLLRTHGFEIVSPATRDVTAQAGLFAEAEIIAGPAGAALANLAFATPGARVIEIVPPQWLAAFHWMISARLGLPHTVILGEGTVMRDVPDVAARAKDLVVAPAEFAAALEASLAAR